MYGYSGIWADTILWLQAHLPSWLTGTVTLNVPASPEGEKMLDDILPTLRGKTVLMSASTQYLLWRKLRETLIKLDDLYQTVQQFGPQQATQLMDIIDTRRKEIEYFARYLMGQNLDALRKGVPPAMENDWIIVELQREPTAVPAAGFLSALSPWGIITIAVAIIAGVVLVNKFWTQRKEVDNLTKVIDEIIATGRVDLIPEILGSMAQYRGTREEKGFNWKWGIGIGAMAVGATVLIAFVIGQAKKMAGG